jgi:glycosyltransferase involved in cell wall biosynthesis
MKIAILTNMMDFNPGYSLTGIIKDQTKMLVKYGHDVHLFVNEQFNKKELDSFKHVTVHQKMPFSHLVDYTSKNDLSEYHKQTIEKTTQMLIENLGDFDFVYTHDFVFTGWFLPYGMGCQQASKKLPQIRWLHWIHSVPSTLYDWWCIRDYGPAHRLIFPNTADRIRVAEQFRGIADDVRVIPHIKDIRTWFNFSEDTCKLIDLVPSVLSSRLMQVLPAGTDRLFAKGVEPVIKIFSFLKRTGNPVCLLIANQWATGRNRKECIEPYVALAKKYGLEPGVDFVFTSDLTEAWANGLPQHMIRELFLCANIFVFPTREESFGLVVPEACLSGVLPVLNGSLDCQRVISGNNALYFDFGSFHRSFEINLKNPDIYWSDLAKIILGRLAQDESLRMKTYFKNMNNMDYLYKNYYAPIMAEAKFWVN